jgi:hypothetical protein
MERRTPAWNGSKEMYAREFWREVPRRIINVSGEDFVAAPRGIESSHSPMVVFDGSRTPEEATFVDRSNAPRHANLIISLFRRVIDGDLAGGNRLSRSPSDYLVV